MVDIEKIEKFNPKIKYCPDCGNILDLNSWKIDGTLYEMTCAQCLTYWDFKRY